MVNLLMLILFILLIVVGKSRGIKAFACFFLSYILVIFYIIFMGFGFNAIILAILLCILITLITLFLLNGINIKTIASFLSVLTIIIITFILIYVVGRYANIQGFSSDSLEMIGSYSFDINYNMTDVIIGMYLICTIGTVIDTSISISSALNEVKINNPKIKYKGLYKSGMKIGRDILSTTINTLYFAFFGGFIGFFFLHNRESISYIINYKAFAVEVIELLFCFISSILIIPITSYICAKLLTRKK